MRYIKIIDRGNGNIFDAAYSDLADSVALHRMLTEIYASEYTVTFSDKPIRSKPSDKALVHVNMDHLFSY